MIWVKHLSDRPAVRFVFRNLCNELGPAGSDLVQAYYMLHYNDLLVWFGINSNILCCTKAFKLDLFYPKFSVRYELVESHGILDNAHPYSYCWIRCSMRIDCITTYCRSLHHHWLEGCGWAWRLDIISWVEVWKSKVALDDMFFLTRAQISFFSLASTSQAKKAGNVAILRDIFHTNGKSNCIRIC